MNQITDSLWISDIRDAREKPLSEHGIDHVVTVCQDNIEDNVGCDHYEWFYLEDGDHDYDEFKAAVDSVRWSLGNDRTVLVHCHVGVSRSASVCAAALGADRGIRADEAFDVVGEARPIRPKPQLRESVREYLSGA